MQTKSTMGIYASRSATTESNLPNDTPASPEWSAVEEPVNQQLRRRRQQKADQKSEQKAEQKPEQKSEQNEEQEEKPEEKPEEPKEASSEPVKPEDEQADAENSDESDECDESEEEIDPRLMIAVFRRPKCENCAAALEILMTRHESDTSDDEDVDESNQESDVESETSDEEEEQQGMPPIIYNMFILIFLIHLIQLFIKMNEPTPRYIFY